MAREKEETKYDDEDDDNFKSDCDYSYAPNVDKNPIKLHDTTKSSSRVSSSLCRKRKYRGRKKLNPLHIINSKLVNIPFGSLIGPNQYGKAEKLPEHSTIQSLSQNMNDVDTSNGFTHMLDESTVDGCYAEDREKLIIRKTLLISLVNSNSLIPIAYNKPLTKPFMFVTDQQDENQLKNNVNNNVSFRNNKVNINIEIGSKAMTKSNNGSAVNVDNEDNDMEIRLFVKETGLIKNANMNSVEINVGVKDKSKMFSKDNLNENDMIVDNNDDNDMDNSQSSNPPGEFVDIYANDNNKNIVLINSLVYGRFPTDFETLLRLKVNETVNHYIPFLITATYIYHSDIDQNTTISLDKVDIKKFDNNVYMGDGVIYCFLRWMSLQSRKISVIDSTSMGMNELTDGKAIKLREKISAQNLILIPIAKDEH